MHRNHGLGYRVSRFLQSAGEIRHGAEAASVGGFICLKNLVVPPARSEAFSSPSRSAITIIMDDDRSNVALTNSRAPSYFRLWNLVADGAPFVTPVGSHMAPVLYQERKAMLKITPYEEERRGGMLMEWWDGVGAAEVFAREESAILLERLTGPRQLSAMSREGNDDEATEILCRAARVLHQPRAKPVPAALVPLEVWFRELGPAAANRGGAFALAQTAAEQLFANLQAPIPLHGDLHHENVLDGGERGWLAIDPKGLIGERGFDYANIFRNPDMKTAAELLPTRLGMVASLSGIEPQRLLLWITAYAGLGAAWSAGSGDDPEPSLSVARRAAAELHLT